MVKNEKIIDQHFCRNNILFFSIVGSYFKVDPIKIGNSVHEKILLFLDSNVGPINYKADALSIDLHSREAIYQGGIHKPVL